VFEEEAGKLGRVDFMVQGTTYPTSSRARLEPAATARRQIKTHHNVGGLPSEMMLRLIEPLRYLFRNEVRQVGLEMELPEEMVFRQPFQDRGCRSASSVR
jgi:GMP synthase (glutamine-hydrolysing)